MAKVFYSDISADLAKRMKTEYFCKLCHEKKVEKENKVCNLYNDGLKS